MTTTWKLYIHLQNINDWSLGSYIYIDKIEDVRYAIALHSYLGSEILRRVLIFVMKGDIKPLWEDDMNKDGGCFSLKITNKDIDNVWLKLLIKMMDDKLFIDDMNMSRTNGISISPKKNFSIIKIWMMDNTMNDPKILNLDRQLLANCIFRRHNIT
jgi:hypothetical protein